MAAGPDLVVGQIGAKAADGPDPLLDVKALQVPEVMPVRFGQAPKLRAPGHDVLSLAVRELDVVVHDRVEGLTRGASRRYNVAHLLEVGGDRLVEDRDQEGLL